MVALSQNEWIKRAKNIHGNQYDYSRVKYVNQHTPIVVVCKTHGEFNVTPSNHVRKMQSENHTPNGCPSCGREKVIARNKAGRQTEEQALKRLVEVHGSLYQYCNYKSYMESIDIVVPSTVGLIKSIIITFEGLAALNARILKVKKQLPDYLNQKELLI